MRRAERTPVLGHSGIGPVGVGSAVRRKNIGERRGNVDGGDEAVAGVQVDDVYGDLNEHGRCPEEQRTGYQV